MGLFSSKKKYYVSSSTFPIFDPDKRINQFQAANIDKVANSQLEYSEYLKNYYDTSRLRNYRGYLNWCKKNNFSQILGNTTTDFYSNTSVDVNAVKDAIIGNFQLTPEDEFGVYSASINLFSIDFYIKQLVTEQGKADLLHNASISYELEYPDDSHVTVKFSNGAIVTGSIPSYKFRDRFLEIAYSITTTKVVTVPPNPPDPSIPPDPTLPEPKPEEQLSITFKYGYIHYKEGTGNSALDLIIKNNGSQKKQSFFPVIPLRAWTAWIGGEQGVLIGKALKYLEVYSGKGSPEECYKSIQKACVDGMKQGSINDIDYITMVPSVSLATDNNADSRYLYEFFYNLYANEAIANGEPESSIHVAKDLTRKLGFLSKFISSIGRRAEKAGFTTGYYQKFNLINETSYLNLSYQWAGSAYFEANGQFRPEAKIGEYGVLFGEYTYTYSHYVLEEYAQDNDGNSKYRWVKITEIETFPVTMFCHQYAKSRWHTLMFADLKLSDHVYHGKYVETFAVDAVKDVASTGSVQHNFTTDKPINSKEVDAPPVVKGIFDRPGPKPDSVFPAFYDFNLKYVKKTGDSNFALIIPLENETFKEIGYVAQGEIAYGSQYFIFNCWIKKKIKWYQQGFFSVVLSFIGMNIALAIMPIAPITGTIAFTYFATALVITASAFMLELTQMILNAVFGERLGARIYSFARSLLGVVCAFVAKIPVFGQVIAAAIMFSVVSGEVLNAGGSLKDAFIKGSIAGALSIAASSAGQYATGATSALGETASSAIGAGVSSAITSTGTALLQGESVGDALKAGLKSGVLGGVLNYAAEIGKDFLEAQGLLDKLSPTSGTNSSTPSSNISNKVDLSFSGFIKNEVIQNPMTYGKLLNMIQEEVYFHKMANLENDYQEFANKYAAAQKAFNEIVASQVNTVTAEFLCKMQANIGRMLTQFPEMLQTMNPESFLIVSTAVGSDQLKAILGAVPGYVDSKLSIDGYVPLQLHYTQTDYSLAWDIN